MKAPSLVQTLVKDHRETLVATPDQHRVLRCIDRCQTAAAGTHTWSCGDCGHQLHANNSCGNRHCPLCQAGRRRAWVQDREEELLPIPYFHVVLTLPHDLLWLARAAPGVVYGALMRCSRQAIAELTADPRYLGAEVGQVQVLHTWGSDLKLHPHVHTIVTGGGLTPDGAWQPCRQNQKNKQAFLVPIRLLAKRMCTLMTDALDQAWQSGVFADCDCPRLSEALWRAQLKAVRKKKWVAYVKQPFANPERVIRYLGRYTHRIAISDARLSQYTGTTINLRWTDYADGSRKKQVTLTAETFLQRFIQHILPPGFRRLRMAGLLGPRVRARKLACARQQLGASSPSEPVASAGSESVEEESGKDLSSSGRQTRTCPHCGGLMIVSCIRRPRLGGGLTVIITTPPSLGSRPKAPSVLPSLTSNASVAHT